MITIMVPALNEEARLLPTVTNIVKNAQAVGLETYDIVIVNDGSTDKTEEVVTLLKDRFPGVRSIHHPRNLGIGASFVEVIRIAKYDRILIIGGDNNVTGYLIQKLLRNYDRADLVGSYFMNSECRGHFRQLLSMVYCMIYVATFDIHLKYINGNTVYSVAQLKKLQLNSKRYSISAEVNTKLLRQGITFFEVGGYAHPEASKSSAIRLANIVEVVRTYLRLVYEVYISDRVKYGKRAQRVGVELEYPSAANHFATAKM